MKIEHWRLLPHHRHCGPARAAELYLDSAAAANESLIFSSSEGRAGYSWHILCCPLEWDSKFFGFSTARLDLIAPPVDIFDKDNNELGTKFIRDVLQKLSKAGFELLTVQVDVTDTSAIHCLEQNGFLLVDTIVGYELNLNNCAPQQSVSQSRIRTGVVDDIKALRAISADCFGDRRSNVNRFNSELKCTQEQITELYELWIANSVTGQLADKVFVFSDNEMPVGFITIKLPSQSERMAGIKCGSIPLNAVSRDQQGKGIYKQLVAAAISWLQNNDIERVQIKTQLPNVAVHSCWQALGAKIYTSFHTFQKDLSVVAKNDGWSDE